MKHILLFGPELITAVEDNAYGGGSGGYTRNMATYLNYYKSEKFQLNPCFHTVRGAGKSNSFVVRFIKDAYRLCTHFLKISPDCVHVLAQYRSAFPREYFVFFVSKVMRKPFLYEIKAGAFIDWYQKSSVGTRWVVRNLLRNSNSILVEGNVYRRYLKEKLNIESVYFPNFVPEEVIPKSTSLRLDKPLLRVLFIGFCYEGKGVYELVKGLNIVASSGVKVSLSFVGHESQDFSSWLDNYEKHDGLEIFRYGRLDYSETLTHFSKNDVYLYPSKHSGEGHNNTINEAMMYGIVIVCSRQGFLADILNHDEAYFLDKVTPEEVANALLEIHRDPNDALRRGERAREKLEKCYSSTQAFEVLESVYSGILPK